MQSSALQGAFHAKLRFARRISCTEGESKVFLSPSYKAELCTQGAKHSFHLLTKRSFVRRECFALHTKLVQSLQSSALYQLCKLCKKSHSMQSSVLQGAFLRNAPEGCAGGAKQSKAKQRKAELCNEMNVQICTCNAYFLIISYPNLPEVDAIKKAA